MEHRLPTPIASTCAAGRARVGVRRFPDRARRALPLGLLLAVAFETEVGAVRSIWIDERDRNGQGLFQRYDPAARMTVQLANGGIDVRYEDASLQFVFIDAAGGPPLAPGRYDGARNAIYNPPGVTPLFSVFVLGDYCENFTGSFVVHEVRVDANDDVLAFSVDYVRECAGDTTRMGFIRFNAGDAACGGMPDGTACDDADACTTDDHCSSGVCVSSDTLTATCPASDQCHVAPLCSPATGTCVAPNANDLRPCDDADPTSADDVCLDGECHGCPPPPQCQRYFGRGIISSDQCLYGAVNTDGQSCDDGDFCTANDQCAAGTCAGATVDCDDRDPCTIESCDSTAGCLHTVVDGCWTTLGASVVRYQAKGVLRGTRVRCETSCRRQFAQATLLEEGDRFRIPGGTVGTCASGMSVLFPDQVGTIGHRRNGALVLETTNLADIAQAATRCRGQTVRLRAGPTVLRPGATDGVLNGVERTSTRIQDTITVVISATSRVRLTRRSEASPTAPSSSPAFRHLRDCPDSIRLRCVAD